MTSDRTEAIRTQIAALPTAVRRLLGRHAFDTGAFLDLARRWIAGGGASEAGRTRDPVAAAPDGSIVRAHPEGSPERAAAEEAGIDAIRRGQVGALVMNGGMATRFGGAVKGAVEVLPGRTFLALKLRQVAGLPGTVPTFVMNSFATEAATRDHLASLRPRTPIHPFTQGISVRLTPDADVFRDPDDPLATVHAPGHGEIPTAFRASGLLRDFVDSGGRWLVLSNVDNAGATVDPAILGQVITSGRRLAVEVAEREPGDAGGMPALVGGRPQILESFRFPKGFDHSSIRWFNTNTLTVAASVLLEDHPLTWFPVRKVVSGRAAIQFERLIGELSAFEEPLLLGVPRTGPRSRFLPVKEPQDLELMRGAIADVVARWGPAGAGRIDSRGGTT